MSDAAYVEYAEAGAMDVSECGDKPYSTRASLPVAMRPEFHRMVMPALSLATERCGASGSLGFLNVMTGDCAANTGLCSPPRYSTTRYVAALIFTNRKGHTPPPVIRYSGALEHIIYFTGGG